MLKNINGIILSGGQSSRMGEDKALMQIGDRKIIELMIEKLKPFCDEIIISADNIAEYSQFSYKVVPDKFKDCGPLAGIYSSLLESNTQKNFIISCDLPLVTPELFKKLIETKTGKEIVLPTVAGKYHQLCGVYSKTVLPKAKWILQEAKGGGDIGKGRVETGGSKRKTGGREGEKRRTSVKRLLEVSDIEFVDVTDMVSENEFLNMNTKEDFAIIEKLLSAIG